MYLLLDTNLIKKGIFTRQFWAIEEINIGEEITVKNIKSIRAPSEANGLAPKNYKSVYGKKAKVLIHKHSPIKFDSII